MPTLEDVLIAQGLVTPPQVEEARRLDREIRGGIGLNLVRLRTVSEENLVEACRRTLPQLVVADQETLSKASSFALGLLPLNLIERHRAIPLSLQGSELSLAMANPLDREAIAAIERHTRCRVVPQVAAESVVSWALLRYFNILTPSYSTGASTGRAAATVSLTDAEADAGLAIPLLRRRRAPVGDSPEDLSQVPVDLAPQRRKSQPPVAGEMNKLEAALARMERQSTRTLQAIPEATVVAVRPSAPPEPAPSCVETPPAAPPAPPEPVPSRIEAAVAATGETPPPKRSFGKQQPRVPPLFKTLPPPALPPPPKVQIDLAAPATPASPPAEKEAPPPAAEEPTEKRAPAATRQIVAPAAPAPGPGTPAPTRPLAFVPPPIIPSTAAPAKPEPAPSRAETPATPAPPAKRPLLQTLPHRVPAVAKPFSTATSAAPDEKREPGSSTRPIPVMPEAQPAPAAPAAPVPAPRPPASTPRATPSPTARPRATTPKMGLAAPFSPTTPGLPGLVPVSDQSIQRLRERIANLEDRDAVTASTLWTMEEVIGPAAFVIRHENAYRMHRAGKHFRAIFGENEHVLRAGQEPRLERAFVDGQVQLAAAQPFPLRPIGRRTVPPQLVLIPIVLAGKTAGVILAFTEKALEVLNGERKRYDVVSTAVAERLLAILRKKKGK